MFSFISFLCFMLCFLTQKCYSQDNYYYDYPFEMNTTIENGDEVTLNSSSSNDNEDYVMTITEEFSTNSIDTESTNDYSAPETDPIIGTTAELPPEIAFCDESVEPNKIRIEISNVFSFGRQVFITQGLDSIWTFDTQTLQLLDDITNLNAIFGPDHFETVHSVFWFDFDSCKTESKEVCEAIGKVTNVVIVFGIKAGNKTYGYTAYELNSDDNTIQTMPDDFEHQWGLTSDGTLADQFWPDLDENGCIIIGTTFVKNRREVILMTTERGNYSYSIHRFYNRKLDVKKGWGQWIRSESDSASEQIIGIFSNKSHAFVVFNNSTVKSLSMEDNGIVDMKTISSAEELFNCYGNTSLTNETLNEITTEIVSTVTVSDEKTSHKSDKAMDTTKPDYDYTSQSSHVSDSFTNSTESSSNSTIGSSDPTITQTGSKPAIGWIIFLVVLFIALILILLIGLFLFLKNKNSTKEKASKNDEKTDVRAEQSDSSLKTMRTDQDDT